MKILAAFVMFFSILVAGENLKKEDLTSENLKNKNSLNQNKTAQNVTTQNMPNTNTQTPKGTIDMHGGKTQSYGGFARQKASDLGKFSQQKDDNQTKFLNSN